YASATWWSVSTFGRAWRISVLLERCLHCAFQPTRHLQKFAGGDHVAFRIEFTHALREILRRRPFESGYVCRREMAKQDVSTVPAALHRGDGRAEPAPQNVGAEIVDGDLVVLTRFRGHALDCVVGVQCPLLIA